MLTWPARLARLAAAWPKTVLTAWLVALIASLGTLADLKLLSNIDEVGGADFAMVRLAREMRAVFPSGTSLFLTFSREGGEPLADQDLCLLRRVVSNVVLRGPEVRGVVSPLHFRDVGVEPRRLRIDDWVPFPCEPGAVTRYVALAKASPWRTLFLGRDAAEGGLKDVFVELSFDVPFERLASDRSPLPFETTLARAKEELARIAPHLVVDASGPGAFQTWFKRALEADMSLNLAGFAVILLIVRVALGTWRAALVLGACLGLLGTFVFAVLAVLGIPIDPLNNALLLMVSVAGVQDYLFVGLSRLRSDSLASKMQMSALAAFLTSATTALGFGALAFSELAIIREFGMLACFAAIAEWALMWTLLPAFESLGWVRLSHIEPRRVREAVDGGSSAGVRGSRLDRIFDALLAKRLPRALALACLLGAILSVISFSRLRMNDDLTRFFDASHPFRRGLSHLVERRGFEGSLSLDTNLADPAAVRKAYEALVAIPGVSGVVNPLEVLDFLGRGAGDDADRRASIESLLVRAPQMAPWFSGRERASGSVFVERIELATLNRVIPAIRVACGTTCRPYGSLVSYEEYSSAILPSLFRSLSATLVVVSLLLAWLAWRSGQARRLPQILIGSFWGPITLLGLFALSGLPVNFVTSIFGSVMVGITGDNAIQYLLGVGDEGKDFDKGVASKGVASGLATGAIAAIAFLFLGSGFAHLRSVGVLFGVGFLLSYFGDVWLAKTRWKPYAAAHRATQ